ncbi:hypothetical protein [Bifidobacterium samirii]|uniref:Uncharacterized protein n=1 Tax=Bifidobacterium samirii TaxID=2306974 RepID=A0A430FRD0_9BIFI|nr:hypothetical protein [Bifidobacterium samirii]RSX55411.1 hypothetical protein D2E24_1315 [Bifidobacterium samirii]
MANGGGMFTPEEIRYLESLPAVSAATANRITYADAFKRHCLRRYREGASPVRLFREAGLDPALVGHKRIERCFARWRDNEAELLAGEPTSSQGTRPGAWSTDLQGDDDGDRFVVDPRRRAVMIPPSDGGVQDLRDLLIAQQIRRIDALERQNDMLRAMLAGTHTPAEPGRPSDNAPDAPDAAVQAGRSGDSMGRGISATIGGDRSQ